MPLTDLEARAERVRAVVEGPGFCRVVERIGDTMVVGLICFVTMVIFVLAH